MGKYPTQSGWISVLFPRTSNQYLRENDKWIESASKKKKQEMLLQSSLDRPDYDNTKDNKTPLTLYILHLWKKNPAIYNVIHLLEVFMEKKQH